MDNSVDKIIAICDELKALLFDNGAFTSYALKLLGELQRLSLQIGLEEREDAKIGDIFAAKKAEAAKSSIPSDLTREEKAQGFYYRKVNGNNIKFNSETGEMIDGQPKAVGVAGMVDQAVEDFSHRHEKIGKSTKGKTATNFEIDGTVMNVATPFMVRDGRRDTGDLVYEIQPGKIKYLQTIGASDMDRKVDVADKISEQYGGEPDDWTKMKGIGLAKDDKGEIREANIHFFHDPNTGQGDWKVVQWVDEMTPAEKWWN